MSYTTDAARWEAVKRKPEHADGHFVYCVVTTKIFCRPTCKARLARWSNVEFYDTAAEAAEAGYRACKRCKPNLLAYTPKTEHMVDRVRLLLDELPEDAPIPKLEDLAAIAHVTKYHFHRCFKRATGLTPRDYVLARRASPCHANAAEYVETADSTYESLVPFVRGDSVPFCLPASNEVGLGSTDSNIDLVGISGDFLMEDLVVDSDF